MHFRVQHALRLDAIDQEFLLVAQCFSVRWQVRLIRHRSCGIGFTH